jgi:hypothetical protein
VAIAVATIANRIPFSGRPVKHETLAGWMTGYEPEEDLERDDGREG